MITSSRSGWSGCARLDSENTHAVDTLQVAVGPPGPEAHSPVHVMLAPLKSPEVPATFPFDSRMTATSQGSPTGHERACISNLGAVVQSAAAGTVLVNAVKAASTAMEMIFADFTGW